MPPASERAAVPSVATASVAPSASASQVGIDRNMQSKLEELESRILEERESRRHLQQQLEELTKLVALSISNGQKR